MRPSGHFNIDKVVGGALTGYFGYSVLTVGLTTLTIATGGTALIAIGTVAFAAGAIAFAASEFGEGVSDVNLGRDYLLRGDSEKYYAIGTVLTLGTMAGGTYCGTYNAMYAPRGREHLEGTSTSAKGTPKSVVKSVDDILDKATAGRVTKGKTTQYVKPGDFSQASNEFDSLNPSNVKNINTSYGQGKTGTLPDGRTVTVRPGSTDGRPTLEIRNPNGRGIKVRYGE